jgi:putative aldouronate transport system substrate-binding protein
MYTDEQVVNLINYGIEGEHYIMLGENTIGYPEGLDPMSHPYALNLSWEFGNSFLSYIPAGMNPDMWNMARESNDSALLSKAFGFVPDMSGVTTEFTNVLSVINQYMLPLNTGAIDPADYLPEFIEKLKSAGIDTIIAAKQAQLDAWLSANS